MNHSKRKEILQQALRYAETTKVFVSEPGAIQALPGALRKLYPDRPIILVADDNTWEAAGRDAQQLLASRGCVVADPFIFPGKPMVEADYSHTTTLEQFFRRTPGGIPLAVGSGTINDLVKLAAHRCGRPYAVAATASSVDGYASDGAALLTKGSKITHACPAPEVIIGDGQLLSTAPAMLTAAGYADLAAKVPAGTDWIIADFLGEDLINPVSWNLVQEHLRSWLSDPGDTEALFIGLTLCGIAMQYQKDSRPVSGAEHLISHVWEMHHHTHQGNTVLHGIKVGIGTLLTTAAYEALLSDGPGGGRELEEFETMFLRKKQLLDSQFAHVAGLAQMEATLREKHPGDQRRQERRSIVLDRWAEVAPRIAQQLFGYRELRENLLRAGCPVTPEEIGMEKSRAVSTLEIAQLIRNRYTILDLLDDLGLLEAWVHRLDQDQLVLT